jgi:ribosome-associated heat shock protein Hsp15
MSEKQPQSLSVLRQRLDKWLFFTRLQKSRSIAQKAIEAGHVRVNDARVTQPSFALKTGDEDLTPPPVPGEKPNAFEQATRERGSGRPTKKERRDVDRLRPGWQED